MGRYSPIAYGSQGPPLLAFTLSSPTQHILYCIVDSECKSRDVLQSYFDLLGELMKFNVDAFKRFNKYINTDAKVSLAWRAGPPGFRCRLEMGGHSSGLLEHH